MTQTHEWHVIGRGPGLNLKEVASIDSSVTPVIVANHALLDVPNATHFITIDMSVILKPDLKPHVLSRNVERCFVANFASGRLAWDGETIYDTTNGIRYDTTWVDNLFIGERIGGFGLDVFHTGNNSGHCAIQAAIMMGARVIHLHGMDYQTHGDQWHYNEKVRPSDTKVNERHDSFFKYFLQGLEFAKEHGIQFINHSALSRLIPYVNNSIAP